MTFKKNEIWIITFLFISPLLSHAQTINRIEPSNWWVGMKYNIITLLVYGDNISELQPTISYPSVQIIKKIPLKTKIIFL